MFCPYPWKPLLLLILPAVAAPAISAQISAENLEEIVVTGSYTTQSMNSATGLKMSLRETPQSVTVITEQMIQDKGLVDMEQLLDHVPGISKVGDASEDSIIYVRGFQLDSGVQVDGLITTPANLTYSGSISQGIDPVIAERVEVLKGAAGILSGLGEPSATVNMIRKRPTDRFQSSLMLSGGNWNTWRTEGDVSGPLSGDGSLRGRLVGAWLTDDSFHDRYGRRKNVVYGILDKDFGQGTRASLAIDRVESRWTGVYNWNSNPAYYTDGTLIQHDISYSTGQEWAYRRMSEWSVTPEIEHHFGRDWTLRASYRYAKARIDVLNATLGSYVDPTTLKLVDPWSTPYALHSDRYSDTHSLNLVASGGFGLFGRRHDVVLGYNYARNSFKLLGSYADLPVTTLNQPEVPAPDFSTGSSPYSAYGNLDVSSQDGFYGTLRINPLDRLKLMAGGRLSHWKLVSTDVLTGTEAASAKEDNVFTPYFGVVFDLNSFASVYASHTGIFLPVTNYGADGKMLDPTKGTNTEFGVKLAFHDNRLNVSAAVYEANKDNVAEWANQGMLPNGEWIYESIDGVKTKGYEIEIAGALTPYWEIGGGFTHNTAKDKDGNVRTTYIPNDVFKLATSYRLQRLLPGLTIGGSARWQSRSWYDFTIDVVDPALPVRQVQPNYWLLDLMARYPIGENLAVSVNVNNVFDKRYNRSMWGYSDYGDPRNFGIAVRWRH